MADAEHERAEELETITAIYPELIVDPSNPFAATLQLPVAPTPPLNVRFVPAKVPPEESYANAATEGGAYIERDVELSHLPPLTLRLALPERYPADAPPKVMLSTTSDWLVQEKVAELEIEVAKLWEEYGHCQILFSYIDFLQQAAERGFDLNQSADGCLVLPADREQQLVEFDTRTKQETFDAGTYDCGVCLEPKKGSACYHMKRCGHVFCRQCLQDFYNNAITEGDVAGVKCLDPDCGSKDATGRKRKVMKERTIHPRELLAMGVEESMVRRYVEMKRKKKLEADKTTVYCPRTWCQGPAKSTKYPPIPADLTAYIDNEISDEESESGDMPETPKTNAKNVPPDPSDRLAVCEKCSLAFCKVCYMGWHGPFARCYPRDPNELSAEEKASYEYIRKNTSPCPYCNAPVQKTMGCNHMSCFQCRTHFCYLCGSWLDGNNPYQHFNKAGTGCYQRLWELEEGDEGQAPEDGRGFAGGRGWEQMAIDAAREADEADAQAAVVQAQAEEDQRAAMPAAPDPPANQVPLIVAMAHMQFEEGAAGNEQIPAAAPQRGLRRPRNPFPANPRANGAAQAVRNHERGARRRPPAANGAAGRGAGAGGRQDEEQRQQAELQRFLALAQHDEEDGWDFDDLGGR
ncbi:E3 ubiquitin-protein ligase itt1 [Fulvia fulva]|uniref:RBR-type E3 ubiquitin transferase n=1 Tax=Passalora fulva TaxID=5499 RepID=A0A9Q8LBA9_PASFU|nr:E3 ubiquitin-protein ligase itt1 [Fulvia fulva]KAK4631220.1 E3 ubiquitin-protein ligase itt1 [Fulvia fulva]UJO14346.1 E3 ubiquitin-protein ligase itt1 [Fulvia fulva]WPV11628.1 E3 ubiquitin-protein ligase itt1 [Fulvia fulva]WPV25453.1 E3 ubiquitin-protein ligase itt1 [Fulvia fulva]